MLERGNVTASLPMSAPSRASKALLISVNRPATETSLYEATRYAWKLNPSNAGDADVILATLQGLIVGAFVADPL